MVVHKLNPVTVYQGSSTGDTVSICTTTFQTLINFKVRLFYQLR